ncbi:hypothetical protein EZS27_015611 [termite gut metagenome]|uniref:Uncharacterized protein n=1 Tax=termite gut metagenome TaxID=433724 RepID=A0A5J4RSD8_9ZZZZ
MAIIGIKSKLFSGDYEDILVTGVSGELPFTIEIDNKVILEETYFADSSGEVRIKGIGNIITGYFNFPVLSFSDALIDTTATCILTFIIGMPVSYVQKILYSSIRTGINIDIGEPPLCIFLTRYTKKRTSVLRNELVSFFENGQRIEIGMAYILEDKAKYTQFTFLTTSSSGNLIIKNISVPVVLSLLQSQTGITLTEEKLLFYDLYSLSDTTINDKLHIENDRRNFPSRRNLLYRNCFGVPETVTFTGADERSMELGGTYSYFSGAYRKTHTLPVPSDKINTGYIDATVADSFYDLVTSDKVFLYENGTIGDEITITDIEMTSKVPDNKPVSYTITYRPSENKNARFEKEHHPFSSKVFDKTFDSTFN